MKIMTVLNFKGGVGKSETTRNIAKGFVDLGFSVLVIDNDPQANTSRALRKSNLMDSLDLNCIVSEHELLSRFLNSNNELGLEDLYDNPEKTKDVIQHTEIKGLDLLGCSLRLATTDTNLRMDAMKPQHDRLKKIIRMVKNDYDYIIIDCPPILNLLTINALVASNSDCIIPIKIDYAGLQGWTMTVKYLNSLKEGFDLDINYKVVFTMVQRAGSNWFKKGQDIIDVFNRTIPEKVFKTVIRNQSSPIVNAGFNSKFVIDDFKAAVGQDYRDLVKELRGM